jgi:Flp pilus assembly pilin Flp
VIDKVLAGSKSQTDRKRIGETDVNTLRNFWNDEQGQDLIEYTLLMAFVALASAALFIGAGGSISGIWSSSNSQLTAANTSAS